MEAEMTVLDSAGEVEKFLDVWNTEIRNTTGDPLPILTRLAEIVEKETEAYLKMDPDPFDVRHPGRIDPQCVLGDVLKAIFKNDDFMTKLINTYALDRDNRELNISSCRLLVDLLPGLETSVIFEETANLVTKLFQWAEKASEPLRSYATGLLGAAMEIPDVADKFRDQNSNLVPIMLKRLWEFRKCENNEQIMNGIHQISNSSVEDVKLEVTDDACHAIGSPKLKRLSSPKNLNGFSENSNSNWAEMEPLVIGSYQMYPLNDSMKQRLILQFLTSTGEFQEFISCIFEQNVLSLVLNLIDLRVNNDVRTAFEALKYLATILCHKKFAIEFLAAKGLEQLLAIHRPSVAATGVSMCFYYLAHNEEAMERICLLPDIILCKLVNFALWLLECSHDSSRCHAVMFFGFCFRYQRILELFDAQDGLRKLFNLISTLEILSVDGYADYFSDDKVFASRQTARNVCMSLKRYYEAHLLQKAQEISRREGNSHPMLLSKASKFSLEVIQENLEIVTLIPFGQSWQPVDKLHELAGISLLLQLIAWTSSWNYSARVEIARSALDVLTICSITARTQLNLCKQVALPENVNRAGIGILLDAAEGKIILDADVQQKALYVLINCVCGSVPRMNGTIRRNIISAKKKNPLRVSDDIVHKVRKSVQAHNGIHVLLSLLTVKTPITDADSIRALACKALKGLVHCESVKQIISKLPLFTSGQLQILMKEPILQDKRAEHVKFCKHALELMEKVTGIPLATGIESSIYKINRADVVAQTKIVYQEKDLLKLIHQHLLSKGYVDSAAILRTEADLPLPPSRPTIKMPQIASNLSPASCTTPCRPIRTVLDANRSLTLSNKTPQRTPCAVRSSLLEKCQSGSEYKQSPIMRRDEINSTSTMTLDNIVTEYLRKQHALCHNPVVTCPPFGLLVPHSCPNPKFRTYAPTNFTARIQQRPVFLPSGGADGAKMDRKLIYSRFCPVKVFRNAEGGDYYTCAAFMSCDQKIALGTDTGELKVYNLYSEQEEHSYECHDSAISHCEPSRDGKLMVTSSAWPEPMSCLWRFENGLQKSFSFDRDHYAEFSRLNQDRIIGTQGETARIYDIKTGKRVTVLAASDQSNNYTKNQATFNPTDELVLSDGVLWDVRSSNIVHKFDKFNSNINGVFHPNGLEVIANSEIWDLRTFHLLRTVPALDQCQVTFNHQGNVLYAAMLISEEDVEMDHDDMQSPFGSSFQTLDPSDYSNIATIDIKKNIFDLCTDKSDRFLAVIEHLTDHSACRLYEIGRRRNEEEEGEEEEEENEVENSNTNSNSELSDDEDFEVQLLGLGDDGEDFDSDSSDGVISGSDADDDEYETDSEETVSSSSD